MKRRSTKQREYVYTALTSLYHPTAEEVYTKLQEENPSIGRATVFRNLAILAEEGRAVKLYFPDDVTRYDPTVDGHYHFMCRRCECIIDLPATQKIPYPESDQFTADVQDVHFYGVCRSCAQESQKEI